MKMWKDFRGHSVIALGLLASFSVFAPMGGAIPLVPPAAAVPGTNFASGFWTTVDATLGPITVTSNPAGAFSGTLEQWVVTDATTGDLDFIYQVMNASTSRDAMGEVSTTDFTGYTTDVGYCSACADILSGGPAGTVAPSTVARPEAETVQFHFDSPNLLSPGLKTYDLVVKTDATQFGLIGTTQVIDGGVFTASTYAPVPEPMSAGLLLGGLFGVGLLVARRFRMQQS